MGGKDKKPKKQKVKRYIGNKAFQKVVISIATIAISYMIVVNGALPKTYRLEVGEKSNYDIIAPRDIENTILTVKLAEEASKAVPPVLVSLDDVAIDTVSKVAELSNEINAVRQSINRFRATDSEEADAVVNLSSRLKSLNLNLSSEQLSYLIIEADDNDIDNFEKATRDIISKAMRDDITAENLPYKITLVQNEYRKSELSEELKNIGIDLVQDILKPNSTIDVEQTDKVRNEAYEVAMQNKQIITEGSRIISYGDIVTEDKLWVLKELNLLETGKINYSFAGGILVIILLLSFLLIMYINYFYKKVLPGRKEIILLCFIILLELTGALFINPIEPLLIPIFIAPMIISILLELRLSIFVNLILIFAISLITHGNQYILYSGVIGGTIAAITVSGATQRSKISAGGLIVAIVNAVIVACIGLINKSSLPVIGKSAALIAVNGMLSTIFTIGALPFFESVFNVITPLKLLELSNPNHPLLKKLLMEAPGTYHHSLMVGNLAEVATEAIKGNALLARVGAYYHDVGKLKRPDYFKENQLSTNPHDNMAPQISAQIISAHGADGATIAEKYKVPLAVRDIISQHHGTTLVAYFYFKAKKNNNSNTNDSVNENDYRYIGPKPASKESAVVMLADSVEAAVRSMPEKTEDKIEAMIHKIIKDKLDDGQLDHCDITLRDLDTIAKSFMRVFGGYFHKREEYPEIKKQMTLIDNDGYNSENILHEGQEQEAKPSMSSTDKKECKSKVYIENEQSVFELKQSHKDIIHKIALACLEEEGIDIGCEINILITDDASIKKMNSEFRNIDCATDVLSFPMVNMKNGKILSMEGDFDLDEELLVLGDIVISAETAQKQAEQYGHSIEREIAFLASHGVFHLLGYDHMESDEERIMRRKQESVLNELGLKRNEE